MSGREKGKELVVKRCETIGTLCNAIGSHLGYYMMSSPVKSIPMSLPSVSTLRFQFLPKI